MGKCKDCKWYGQQDAEALVINKSGMTSSSMENCHACKRNAPSIMSLKKVGEIVHAELGFPKTHPEDWCGDFEPKE